VIESRIARRYLWSARRRAHTVIMSAISILGLAIGVAALLVSIALLSGMQGQIKERLIASSPTILVEPAKSNTIENAAAVIADGKRLGMRDVQPIVTGIGWGANAEARRGRPLRIRSYQPKPNEAAASEPTIQLTREFAAAIGLDAGDAVTVVAPRTRLTPFGPVPVWRKYRIEHILDGPADERLTDGMLTLAEAESLFGTDGKPTSIEMYGPVDLAESAQAALAQRHASLLVKTWKEINRPLFLALRLEKIVMFASISLIIFVAALNLISSLSMLIVEKRPQVGILRTIGATERTILSTFLQVGLFIGITGTVLGNILGVGFTWAANRYHLVRLPTGTYAMSHLPFTLDGGDVIVVNLIAITLSVLATWYPARVASRLDPITAIREQ
jgi:lipoprotein-releasing system permease protein